MSTSLALVTGAAGFIGSHLCERLVAEGWRVRGVDCFTPYYDPAQKEQNVSGLVREPRFELIRADLRSFDLAPLLEGVEVVWHLAAQAGVRASWGRTFEEYTTINVNATQRLLEAVVGLPIRRFVYSSSSSVYGEAPVFPMPEDGPLRPISPYGVTKLAGEHLARLYALNWGVPAVSLRYFTVYGPRQRPDMSFHRFLRALFRGEGIAIYGDGLQTRDFTFVGDAVEANVLAALRGENGESYNVSGGSRVTLLDAVRLLEKVAGRKAEIEFQPPKKGDARNTGGDASRARDRLGFRPAVGLEDGLTRMGAWMRTFLGDGPE